MGGWSLRAYFDPSNEGNRTQAIRNGLLLDGYPDDVAYADTADVNQFAIDLAIDEMRKNYETIAAGKKTPATFDSRWSDFLTGIGMQIPFVLTTNPVDRPVVDALRTLSERGPADATELYRLVRDNLRVEYRSSADNSSDRHPYGRASLSQGVGNCFDISNIYYAFGILSGLAVTPFDVFNVFGRDGAARPNDSHMVVEVEDEFLNPTDGPMRRSPTDAQPLSSSEMVAWGFGNNSALAGACAHADRNNPVGDCVADKLKAAQDVAPRNYRVSYRIFAWLDDRRPTSAEEDSLGKSFLGESLRRNPDYLLANIWAEAYGVTSPR